jgi:CheY-like chemotaxis protein
MSKKILVIDDNDDLLDLIKEILEQNGYEVECLGSTDNIIHSVVNIKTNLIILDYLLSGINGGELCAQLKKDPLTSHLPVLIMSAYPQVLKSLGHYGQDAFVAKPFEIEELLETVSHFLLKTDHKNSA